MTSEERPARILIVEDSPTYAKLAALLLRACGHSVLRAADATEGLRIARDEKPDLILMDMRLPDLDGVQAVRRLRADPATAGITTIGLTADRISSETERERVRAAGFDDYVEKPFTEAAFRALLASTMGPSVSDPTPPRPT